MYRGSRIALAPLRAADSAALLEWINERDEVLLNAAYSPVGQASHEQWFEQIQRRADVRIFGIRTLPADELIGTCQLHSISPVHRSCELQIRIGEVGARGRGFGTEAVSLLLDFAFDDLNMNRVYLHVFADNARAIRAYEKAGFVREGLLREAAFVGGRYVDVVVMGILRRDRAA